MSRHRGVIEPDWEGNLASIDDTDYESRPKINKITNRKILKAASGTQNLKSPQTIYQERAANETRVGQAARRRRKNLNWKMHA
jgi:hypothetical protein